MNILERGESVKCVIGEVCLFLHRSGLIITKFDIVKSDSNKWRSVCVTLQDY